MAEWGAVAEWVWGAVAEWGEAQWPSGCGAQWLSRWGAVAEWDWWLSGCGG